MAERPMLMSAPMVRALLAGTKTQTRRVVKPQFASKADIGHYGLGKPFIRRKEGKNTACPYGQPGDRLWVRESFCDDWRETRGTQYRADGELDSEMFDAGCKWQPSIHMPRAASRILLEVTAVRVERLQDISESDAMAEGVRANDPCDHTRYSCAEIGCSGPGDYRGGFKDTWESINGPGSWGANPWVWVVEFKRVRP